MKEKKVVKTVTRLIQYELKSIEMTIKMQVNRNCIFGEPKDQINS